MNRKSGSGKSKRMRKRARTEVSPASIALKNRSGAVVLHEDFNLCLICSPMLADSLAFLLVAHSLDRIVGHGDSTEMDKAMKQLARWNIHTCEV